MRIRMRTTMAGPDGVVLVGKEVELPKKKAEGLIEAGYAEQVVEAPAPKKEEAKKPEAKETATAEPAENAMAPPARRRRVKGNA